MFVAGHMEFYEMKLSPLATAFAIICNAAILGTVLTLPIGEALAEAAPSTLAPTTSPRPKPNPFYEVRTNLAPTTSPRPHARPNNLVNGKCFWSVLDGTQTCYDANGQPI
jgi:hypothetical protein